LQTEILAYTGQQLIPDPWCCCTLCHDCGAMDLGSVTNVMEEPAVELPLLTGQFRMILKIILKKKELSLKLQA